MIRLACLCMILTASGAARAQSFQYTAGWFTGVRDNVLALQERQRARIEALQARRAQERAKLAAAAMPMPGSDPVSPLVVMR